jgi:hypothetical protein
LIPRTIKSTHTVQEHYKRIYYKISQRICRSAAEYTSHNHHFRHHHRQAFQAPALVVSKQQNKTKNSYYNTTREHNPIQTKNQPTLIKDVPPKPQTFRFHPLSNDTRPTHGHNMSLQSTEIFTTIPDQSTSSDQAILQQFNRAARRHDKKKREQLHRRRVLDHFRQVDRALHDKRRRSAHIYVKRHNEQLRMQANTTARRCSCILFGEEGYFLHESEKKYGPTLGFRIVLHVDAENPERRVIKDYWDSDSDSGEGYWDSDDDQSTNLTSSYHSDSNFAEEELFNQIESNINNEHENKEDYVGFKQEGSQER